MPTNQRRVASRPFGVTMLSVVQFIMGIIYLIGMRWAFGVSSWASTTEGQDKLASAFGASAAESIPGIFLLVGIVYLALGISSLILSRGYLVGREKARRRGRTVALLAIAFVVLCLLFPIPQKIAPDSPLWTLFVNASIYIYLGREAVRAYFRPD